MADKPKPTPKPTPAPNCTTCNNARMWYVNGKLVLCTACM